MHGHLRTHRPEAAQATRLLEITVLFALAIALPSARASAQIVAPAPEQQTDAPDERADASDDTQDILLQLPSLPRVPIRTRDDGLLGGGIALTLVGGLTVVTGFVLALGSAFVSGYSPYPSTPGASGSADDDDATIAFLCMAAGGAVIVIPGIVLIIASRKTVWSSVEPSAVLRPVVSPEQVGLALTGMF